MASSLKKLCRIRVVALAILVVYLAASLYTASVLFAQVFYHNATGIDDVEVAITQSRSNENLVRSRQFIPSAQTGKGNKKVSHLQKNTSVIEILGKAAIGHFLWEHVLGGSLHSNGNLLIRQGNLTRSNTELRFITGPGLVPGHDVSRDVDHLALVLNGRNDEKQAFAKLWLDSFSRSHHHRLRRVVLFLLGNERCDNDWILPYTARHGGFVDVTFLVYDSPLVDDRDFRQWPLGVATYRNFPRFGINDVEFSSPRQHLCNFMGTVYPNSSREKLQRFLNDENIRDCVIRTRYEWQPTETDDTRGLYISTLLASELTLCPVGINTECYRIYEAMSCGSVPVVEDVMTPGKCSHDDGAPLRLLKKYEAPVVYVEDWQRDLPVLLEKQRAMSEQDKAKQRQTVVKWYHAFLDDMKNEFIEIIHSKFEKQDN